MYTLPLELLVKIFVNLSCVELTRMTRVCRLWRDITRSDPCLRRACFKQASAFYFDDTPEPDLCPGVRDTRVRFHPAMEHISYQIGETLSTVYVHNHEVRECRTSLADLPLHNDFATIPAAGVMDIEIFPEEAKTPRKAKGIRGLKISVSNPTGVRLGDIFSSIVTESMERCDLVAYASGGLISNQWLSPSLTFHKKAEILGRFKSYAGVKRITMENDEVKVKLRTVLQHHPRTSSPPRLHSPSWTPIKP